MRNAIAITFALAGTSLLTFLLRSDDIGGPTFAVTLAGVLIFSYVLHRGESVTEVDLKSMKVTLQQIERAKSDIYAKVDSVRQLGERIAAIGVWNVRTASRWLARLDHQRDMLAARDQIAEMLRDLGSDERRIGSIVEPINQTVVRDLKGFIRQEIWDQVSVRNREGDPLVHEEAKKQTDPLIEQYDRERLTTLLEQLRLYSLNVKHSMENYERFEREQRL